MSENDKKESEESPKGKTKSGEALSKAVHANEGDSKAAAKEAEERALKRFCEASGVDYAEVIAKEKKIRDRKRIQLDMKANIVHINGQPYGPGVIVVDEDLADQLRHMVGAKIARYLNEKIGKNYEVIQTVTGGIGSRLIGIEPEGGENV